MRDRATARLLDDAEHCRAASIRTRILTAFTFLSVTESEARFTSVEKADASMAKVRHVIQELEGHINEPRYVPPETGQELRDLLQKLQSRTEEVESWLASLRRGDPGAMSVSPPKI